MANANAHFSLLFEILSCLLLAIASTVFIVVFIFSCFTGLAYIDVKQLSQDNIAMGIDGEKWIFKNRQKTDTTSKIPLLPSALEIIKKVKK